MNRTAALVSVALAAITLGVAATVATAQCEPKWQPFDPSTATFPGTDGIVHATTMWDPDGQGPQTPKLVVGGSFTLAGNAVASNIAVFDPDTSDWSALGSGTDGAVHALAAMPNGDLIAGGAFSFAGGVQVNWIARWNGSAWSALGSGVGGSTFPWVYALAILPNGDLVAGGAFSFAGGVLVGHVARWDGSAWSALGSGVGGGSSHIVFSLATLPNGDLVAGGLFTTAGGAPASAIARWNGSAWFPLGTGVSWGTLPAVVRSLAALSNGDLVAGGDFASAGGVPANRIARWNGSSWSALGSGTNGSVRALRVLPSGDLVAGGSFLLAGGAGANHIAR